MKLNAKKIFVEKIQILALIYKQSSDAYRAA